MDVRNPSSDDLPRQIRQAVAAGSFEEAQLLWKQYAEKIRAEFQLGPVPESRLTEARELAEWTRIAVLCARAHAHDRLKQITVATRYQKPDAPPATSRVTTTA